MSALVGLLAMSCSGDDVVARRLGTCTEAACAPRVEGCVASVCERSACDTTQALVRAADTCDEAGSAWSWNALCSCSDVSTQEPVRIVPEVSGGAVAVSVVGRIAAEQSFSVEGSLYSLENPADPNRVRADAWYQTTAPCDCDETSFLDFDQVFSTLSRDAASGELDGFTEPQTVRLSCGTRVLDRIAGSAGLTLEVSGHTLLFVDGNVELDDTLTISVGQGAQLELVVRGSVRVAGAASLGNPGGELHLFVGAGGTTDLRGALTLHGSLYAPRSELVLAGTSEVHGSLFVRRLASEGALDLYATGPGVPAAACESTRAAASAPLFTASGMPTP